MINWLKARANSFRYAFQGFRVFFTSEVHARVHAIAGITAVLMGLLFKVPKYDWLWLFSAIAFVISAEIFNSSIEVLVDMVSPEKSDTAGKAKDMAAAAVVVAAIYAVLIGIWIFGPTIYSYLISLKALWPLR